MIGRARSWFSTGSVVGAVLALVLAVASPARAEGPDLDPDTEAAKRHFERGLSLYGEARYADAIREFEVALQAKPSPAFLYNIARCYDRLERWADAARYYERYLASSPRAPDAAEVRERIAALRRRAPEASATPPAPRPIERAAPNENAAPVTDKPIAEPRRTGVALRLSAIAVGAVAVAAAVAGTGLVLSVNSDFQQARRDCTQRQCVSSDWSGMAARADAGYALWAVAGAAAATDVVLWVLDARSRRAERAAWLVPMPTGVAVAGRF